MTETQTIATKLTFNHKAGKDFYSRSRIVRQAPIEKILKSCGCSEVTHEDGWITMIIKADKFPSVQDNVPTEVYKNGKRDYTKRVSASVVYEDGEKVTYQYSINVT